MRDPSSFVNVFRTTFIIATRRGRTVEFSDDLLNVQPTVPGRLLGHLFLGRDLVRDTARELGDVNPELVQLLEHIIVTHLALPEWGSPKLPLIPECLIIHHADDLDAKLEMYVRCLTRDKEPGDEAFSGTLNGNGLLHISVTRAGQETTLSRVIRLVEEAREQRAPVERLADRFVR